MGGSPSNGDLVSQWRHREGRLTQCSVTLGSLVTLLNQSINQSITSRRHGQSMQMFRPPGKVPPSRQGSGRTLLSINCQSNNGTWSLVTHAAAGKVRYALTSCVCVVPTQSLQ